MEQTTTIPTSTHETLTQLIRKMAMSIDMNIDIETKYNFINTLTDNEFEMLSSLYDTKFFLLG
jgi:hypothetical protein